jgi:hypothetical protein
MALSKQANPNRTFLLSGGLALASFLTFVAGATLLGIGLTRPSSSTIGTSGPAEGGLFSRLGKIVSVPSGGGPEDPGYKNGRPVGLYLMTRYWIATGSLEKAVWYFTSDGRVYLNLEDGFSDEKLAAHKGQHGTASVDGDNLIVTWSDGKKTSSPLEREKGGFNWDMGLFAPVEGFSNDSDLVGRWEGGTSVTFSGNYAATSKTLDFRQDGTFTGEAIASLRSQSDKSTVSGGSQGTSAGTWQLDEYTLILTYPDGKVVRGISFPFGDEKTERFYFGGTMYKKL